jgi:2-polyprenyl-6-methoxyphenol hydroxylase-like FAD-dependent oxidoreductase
MHHADIAIVGGGLAGSTAAAMLGRAGIGAVLIDPHTVYPPDFRCEKLDASQVATLRKTGLADAVLRAATHDGESWVARFGRLVDKRPGDQHGILYDALVNTIRAEIPSSVAFVHAKVTGVANSPNRQTIALSNGEEISARLLVLANGLNSGLRHRLGMTRVELSKCHSIMLGFDLAPVGRDRFDFPALTYYAERAADRTAFVTLFPVGTAMRANLSVYREMDDPWLRAFRDAPEQSLLALMPGLRQFTGGFAVPGAVKIRPADLYVTGQHLRPGVVLVGDAFATSCPAAGTGTGKVFTDVERLCNVHIPRWLASDGMDVEKIATFYADPAKRACDAHSAAKAYHLRSLSIEAGVSWRARRWMRFTVRLGVGLLRRAHEQVSLKANERPGVAVRTRERFRKPA